MMDRFHLLNVGLGLVLVFIGAKMLAADFVHVSIQLSLARGGAAAGGRGGRPRCSRRSRPATAAAVRGRPLRPLEARAGRREPPFGAVARGRRRGYHPGGLAIPPSPRTHTHSQDRTMNVFIPKERPGENRVAATPETVKKLIKDGLSVTVEAGAGEAAHFADAAYRDAGATLGSNAADAAAAWSAADLVLKVGPPSPEEARRLKTGAVLVGLLAPDRNLDAVRALARPQGERAGHGADPPGQPGAIDGRPVVAGVDRRLQGGAARRRPPRPLLPAADDRRRHHPAVAGGDHGRRGGGADGDRHRQAPGRGGRGVRHPRGGQGAGASRWAAASSSCRCWRGTRAARAAAATPAR